MKDLAPFVVLFALMLAATFGLVAVVRQDARLHDGRLFPQHVGTAAPQVTP